MVLSMNATTRPSSKPTEESRKPASSSVSWRRSLPSGFIDQRFLSPSRSLSNTIRVPSGVKALRASLDEFEVSRMASPPADGARHRSPRQENTTVAPSGDSDGKRGRSTCAACAVPAMAPTIEARSATERMERLGVGIEGVLAECSRYPACRWMWPSAGASSLRPFGPRFGATRCVCAGKSEERSEVRQTRSAYAPIPRWTETCDRRRRRPPRHAPSPQEPKDRRNRLSAGA